MSEGHARAEVKLTNMQGLHARPSSLIVKTANAYDAKVTLRIGNQTADCKSIMEVMMLASPRGTPMTVEAEGREAAEAVSALVELIRGGFGEGGA